ncbi:unnamed protein product [Bubo scandiacus]
MRLLSTRGNNKKLLYYRISKMVRFDLYNKFFRRLSLQLFFTQDGSISIFDGSDGSSLQPAPSRKAQVQACLQSIGSTTPPIATV